MVRRYWFGVLGDHPLFPDVRAAALAAADTSTSPRARDFVDGLGDAWDPFAFVEFCAAAPDDPDAAAFAAAVQDAEWALLHERTLAAVAAAGEGSN